MSTSPVVQRVLVQLHRLEVEVAGAGDRRAAVRAHGRGMGAPGDEGDVVAMGGEPRAEIAADAARTQDRDLHAVSPGLARSRRPASITSRIRRTASGRPIATASPTRKWPMFNSTIWAMRRHRPHVGIVEPVAGMALQADLGCVPGRAPQPVQLAGRAPRPARPQ